MARCEFVEPSYQNKCGATFGITRVEFVNPLLKIPEVFFACKKHGDIRFNSLSMSEIEIQKMKDNDKVGWKEGNEKLGDIRWNICRRCNEQFRKEDVVWNLLYFSIKNDIQVRMRRSFLLHRECAMSEMTLYKIRDEKEKFKKLDTF